MKTYIILFLYGFLSNFFHSFLLALNKCRVKTLCTVTGSAQKAHSGNTTKFLLTSMQPGRKDTAVINFNTTLFLFNMFGIK